MLALIDCQRGDRVRAGAELIRVRDETLRTVSVAGEASPRHELALVALEQGAYDQARTQLTRVRELYRELGNLAGERAAHCALCNIDFIQGGPLDTGYELGPGRVWRDSVT